MLALIVAAGCAKVGDRNAGVDAASSASAGAGRVTGSGSADGCPGDNGDLTLPAGFCATVFADSLGHARHVAVAPNGDVFVNTWSGRYYPKGSTPKTAFIVALRDTSRGGRANVIERFGGTPASGATGGTGIAVYDGYVYAESGDRIVRFALASSGPLRPASMPETIVSGLPVTGDHPMHSFAIDSAGSLLVNVGSASNSCQTKNRTLNAPGQRPCAELERRGGVWRFAAKRAGQPFSPGDRFVTGLRNAVGMAINPADSALYATQHGRDQLAENWPSLYKPEQGAELPAEELVRAQGGADFGWPYCYYDQNQQKLVLAPEYGGDGGKAVGQCAAKRPPLAAFPAHWAPDGLLFYSAGSFPAHYRGGAFIAFHGSWNRAPFPQAGYRVVFLPFAAGKPIGDFETFAEGFAGAVMQPDQAAHRPVGLAEGPDGALYITDDVRGRVWRVTYRGKGTGSSG
ncbi:MAG: sorbosone dehydrogenase family protein [Gemmatimonadaceae bacterium]